MNQIPGIGYFVMALASLPGKLVLGWVVLMGAAFSIIGTAIASLARQNMQRLRQQIFVILYLKFSFFACKTSLF